MKIFIKLLLLLLIGAIAAPFFLKTPEGRPLITLEQIKIPELSIFSTDPVSRWFRDSKDNETDSIKVYKWRDEKGVVHYSDYKKPGQEAELTEIKGISILPSMPKSETKQQKADTLAIPSPGTAQIGQIPKLIDDARQLEQVLGDRKKRQDEIIDAVR